MSIEPGADVGVQMAGGVVEDEVEILRPWKLAIESAEEAEELLVSVPGSALTNDGAVEDVERGIEIGGAVSGALLAVAQNDAMAESMARESPRIGHDPGDPDLICWASGALLCASVGQGKSNNAASLAESIVVYARSSQWWAEPIALNYLYLFHLAEGAVDAAARGSQEALELCRRHGELCLNTLSGDASPAWRAG